MRRTACTLVIVISVFLFGFWALKAKTQGDIPTRMAAPSVAPLFQAAGTRSLRSIHLIASPVVLDGNLNEWPLGDQIVVSRDTSYSFSGRIDGSTDISASVRSAWNDTTLYFAFQVIDDVVVTDSTDVWRDDGVEVGLDGLRDKQSWGADDHQYTVVADGRTAERGVTTADIAAAVARTPDGYNIEMAVPMAKLIPGVPISGTVMGFTVGIHDDDDGGNWDAYLIWEGTNTSSAADQFGSLTFAERPEDRIALLEAKVSDLERKVQELLQVLSEFEGVTPP